MISRRSFFGLGAALAAIGLGAGAQQGAQARWNGGDHEHVWQLTRFSLMCLEITTHDGPNVQACTVCGQLRINPDEVAQ